MTASNRRDIWIDSLRGFAAFGVMIVHILGTFPNIGIKSSGTGKIFVCLFMFITGYYAFVDIETKYNIYQILHFYFKKFYTIVPQFIVCLFLGLFLKLYDYNTIISTLQFKIGLMHFWYIPVVLGFYFTIPFFRMILHPLNNRQRIIAITLIIILFEILFPWYKSTENSIEFWWYIPCFLIGYLIRIVTIELSLNKHYSYDILSVICLITFILIVPGVREFLLGIPSDKYLQNKLVFMTFLWGLFCIFTLKSKYLFKFLNCKNLFSCYAKYGYSLYLIHFIILTYFMRRELSGIHLLFFTSITSCIGAIILYYIVQYPIIIIIRRIKNSKK